MLNADQIKYVGALGKGSNKEAQRMAENFEALVKTRNARQQRAVSVAKDTIKQIESIFPDKSKTAASLKDFVMKTATEEAIPLAIKRIHMQKSRHIIVIFKTPKSNLPSPPPEHVTKKAVQRLLDGMSLGADWVKKPGMTLVYTTAKPVPQEDIEPEAAKIDLNDPTFKSQKRKALSIAKAAKANAPISEKDANSLYSVVTKLADKGYAFDVVNFYANTTTGAIRCYLTLLHPKSPTKDQIKAALKALQSTLLSSSWRTLASSGGTSSLTGLTAFQITSMPYRHLIGAKSPSESFKKFLSVGTGTYAATSDHLGALEGLLKKEGDQSNLRSAIAYAERDGGIGKGALSSLRESFLYRIIEELTTHSIAVMAANYIDAPLRQQYQNSIKAETTKIKAQLSSGKISIIQAEYAAHRARNEIVKTTRKLSTKIGRDIATALKPAMPLDTLRAKKIAAAQKSGALPLKVRFEDLTDAQQNTIRNSIIGSADSSRPSVNALAKHSGKLFAGLGLISLAFATHSVVQAENKRDEAARQAVGLAAGAVGNAAGAATMAAVATATAVSLPGILVIGAVIGTGIVFSIGASYAFDYFVDD